MPSHLNRRKFLKAVGTSAATFTILQAGSARTYAANEKLSIACIGAGGRGAVNIRDTRSENIVALCDVDFERVADSFKNHDGLKIPNAKRYKDYRVMLSEMESKIDAVIVSTPDHHHFHASMAAIRLGKHVYCEKPLTHSIWEARELAKAAREAGVATQMGNQAQADKDTRLVQEFVMDNAIGPIREAHIWTDRPSRGLHGEYWPQGVPRPTDTPAVPAAFDWDLWIGPAPMRPYHPSYAPFKWRGWWDFGTGALGDMGCHYFDPVYRACARFGGFDAAAMAAFHRATRDAQPYLRFFDRLDYDLRRRLVHTAQGPAVFDRLATDAGMDEFRQGLDAMKAVRFVSSIEALQRFLNNDWARLKQNAQQVLAGQHAAVDAMRGALAGESVLAALAGAEGAFGAAVRGAGFEFDRESVAPQVAQQAQRLLAMQRVEQCIEVESVRQLVSRDANVAPSDVTSIHLWRFLRNAANARALLAEAARGGHALTDRDRDLTALARQRTEERVLARIRRNTMEMGSGWLGMGERMGWLISVSMLVCGIGITNAMLVSVTERFREIATLKCLGALDGFILILFVFESCILGVAGGFLGALLGSLIGVGRAISEFGFALPGGLPVTALLSGGALSIGAGVILAALAAVYPALKASRLAPMEAMRID